MFTTLFADTRKRAASPEAIASSRLSHLTQPPARAALPPMLGNQAALRLLGRSAAKPRAPLPGILQAKLTIGDVDDPLEHEADQVADRVMRMTDSAVSLSTVHPRISRKCAHCDEEEKQEDYKLYKKSGPPSAASANTCAPPIVHDVLKNSGQPLDDTARSFFEPRFMRSFDGVRVHTDPQAAESAAAVGALAYTVGNDVVFAQGQYNPGSSAGQRLMAHELSHVVQQKGGIAPRAKTLQRAHDALSPRDAQLACVIRLGGCAGGPMGRDGGVPDDQLPGYNAECRAKTQYADDITPTPAECLNPPHEPLSTIEQIALGAFLIAGAAAAIAVTIAASEVIIPIVITAASDAAMTATVAYLSNAIVVNEVGLFAAGLLIACEGNVPGLLRALADDPLQAAYLLGEVIILHANVRIAGGPSRRASIPAKLLSAPEQTDPANIKFRTAGAPQFEEPPAGQTAPAPQPKSPAEVETEQTPAPPVAKPAAPPGPAPAQTAAPAATAVDWEIDQSVEQGIVEEAQPSARPSQPKPQPPATRGAGAAARVKFNSLRDGYAQKLGVASGGQVHHAIELQVLDRYPGAFAETELNALPNMRGIPPENNNLRQLHNAKIRDVLDRHYRNLDGEIASRDLTPNTPAYNQLVRFYLEDARAELDYTLGQFFSEQRNPAPK